MLVKKMEGEVTCEKDEGKNMEKRKNTMKRGEEEKLRKTLKKKAYLCFHGRRKRKGKERRRLPLIFFGVEYIRLPVDQLP